MPAGLITGTIQPTTWRGQLLAAQLNLAAGAETYPGAEQAIQAAQLLLLSLRFDGTQNYLQPTVESQERDTALILIDQLSSYNIGELCVP